MAEVFAFKEESAIMAKASKRIAPKEFISKTGVVITEAYCRKCMKTKSPRDFYQAVDPLDSNGIMSICKSCCQEIYDQDYLSERTMSRAFLKVCRTLNVVFDERIVESVLSQISKAGEDGRTAKHPFAIYRIRISAMLARGDETDDEANYDLTFHEPHAPLTSSEEENEMLAHDDFWGGDYSQEDIDFLERQFREFKRNYTVEDDKATISLLVLACKLLLEMKDKPTGALETRLTKLYKELAISPQHQKAEAGGKMKDALGVWIKEIELYSPAEWLESLGDKRDLHHDIDNVNLYYENFVKRPIKNFMSGNPDYNIINDEGKKESWEI